MVLLDLVELQALLVLQEHPVSTVRLGHQALKVTKDHKAIKAQVVDKVLRV